MENNISRNFIIGIVAVLAIVLLVNNFGKMSGAVTYSSDSIRYGNCVLNEDCNLKTGDVTYIDGVKIMIGTIGSRGDVRIGVDDEVITIGKGKDVSIKELRITNKVAYYDWKDSRKNYVVLLITKEGGLSKEVTYVDVGEVFHLIAGETAKLNYGNGKYIIEVYLNKIMYPSDNPLVSGQNVDYMRGVGIGERGDIIYADFNVRIYDKYGNKIYDQGYGLSPEDSGFMVEVLKVGGDRALFVIPDNRDINRDMSSGANP